jgi:peptide/nickel transport system ATP-binding protein
MSTAPTYAAPVREACLTVENLTVEFATREGWSRVVSDLSFSVRVGETLAIVGESGSGKSVTSLACMGLLPPRISRVTSGRAVFGNHDLLSIPRAALEDLRGDRVSMAFQEPMTSLNPAHRVGDQIAEVIERHRGMSRRQAQRRVIETLELVGIPQPEIRAKAYPHEFSGGMRQRVMIAMSIACEPDLLIADELTTALDVTVQAQVLDVLKSLRDELGMALIVITHDLGVVADIADRVMVMYAGRTVEAAGVEDLFERPRHPYTEGLLRSMPLIGRNRRLDSIPGQPPAPSPGQGQMGCSFAPRCPYRTYACTTAEPPLVDVTGGRSRCLRTEELNLRGVA